MAMNAHVKYGTNHTTAVPLLGCTISYQYRSTIKAVMKLTCTRFLACMVLLVVASTVRLANAFLEGQHPNYLKHQAVNSLSSGTKQQHSHRLLPVPPLFYQNDGDETEQEELSPTTFQQRKEEPLYDHDDWVRHRSNRADESETIATVLFGSFVALLWAAVFQMQ